MAEILVTKEGYAKLVDKLNYLKDVKRAEISEKIAFAKTYGDLSENSTYHAAKEEQNALEYEIAELEQKINNAVIVEKGEKDGTVSIGSKVKVFDEEFNEEIVYEITGAMESSPAENKISVESPIGKALMGKKKGDCVEAVTPGGTIKLKVMSVK